MPTVQAAQVDKMAEKTLDDYTIDMYRVHLFLVLKQTANCLSFSLFAAVFQRPHPPQKLERPKDPWDGLWVLCPMFYIALPEHRCCFLLNPQVAYHTVPCITSVL